VSTGAPSEACAAVTAGPRLPSLDLCFDGALHGSVLAADRDTTSCTALDPSFTATFVTLLNSEETRLELTDDRGPGVFDLGDPTADLTVTVVQAAKQKSWSNIGAAGASGGVSGRVSVRADRSGSLDVTLGERDLTSGAPVSGAPPLRVRGTFRCPA
jgi:hypothetical protein